MKEIFHSFFSAASSLSLLCLLPQVAKVSSHLSAEFPHTWAEVQLWLCAFRSGRALLHVICAVRKGGRSSSMHWLGLLREWRHQ